MQFRELVLISIVGGAIGGTCVVGIAGVIALALQTVR
jgi:hypothetical protein